MQVFDLQNGNDVSYHVIKGDSEVNILGKALTLFNESSAQGDVRTVTAMEGQKVSLSGWPVVFPFGGTCLWIGLQELSSLLGSEN